MPSKFTGIFLALFLVANPVISQHDSPEEFSSWIQEMKTLERGPFSRIRWFCNDGTVLPPNAQACRDHGGGRQHGDYNEQTQTIRNRNYYIANVLSALTGDDVLANDATRLKWILLERFLMGHDDGWIFRKARYYRGAVQSEGETRSAQNIIRALLNQPAYQTSHYMLAREAARLLPWLENTGSLDRARALVITIAENDPGFRNLRTKIHTFPEPADIEAVRNYSNDIGEPSVLARFEELLRALEETYEQKDLAPEILEFAQSSGPQGRETWMHYASSWQQADSPLARYMLAGRILVAVRNGMQSFSPVQRPRALRLSLIAEQAAFSEAINILSDTDSRDRNWYLQRLSENLDVLYGTGFLTQREWQSLKHQIDTGQTTISLNDYRSTLDYISRVPGWVVGRFNFFFKRQIMRFAEIEPLVYGFVPDRMRGSPLFMYSQLLQELSTDAASLTGIQHELFGRRITSGVRSLNPGIARGPLHQLEDSMSGIQFKEIPIVLAPESIADLPQVAGILTLHEGNTLSHIQLLARNLGIPNVVVDHEILRELENHINEKVVMLSSPGGIVRLNLYEPKWDSYFSRQEDKPVIIQVGMEKLNLDFEEIVSLSGLRASDSGRIVGPKAAKLGELMAHFPDNVSPGIVLPFGLFKKQLDTTIEPDGTTLFEWMRLNYSRLEQIADFEERQLETSLFLTQLRQYIGQVALDEEFIDQLKMKLQDEFGEEGSYGVFVRSDTNVEDLPGFTGAGLNLTVPNVVGTDNIVQAIKSVWASPFGERAYGWRQALMEQPEHIYASVLLHKSVRADKSGVMITADVMNNNPGWYSISVNEGVGGGVEGQTAESLKVNRDTGEVILLSSAAEPFKRTLPAEGGTRMDPASGTDEVLTQQEIDLLVEFGRTLPEYYPDIIDSEGNEVPADIEFAFANGRLSLIQIRPFLQSIRAQRNQLLSELDINLNINSEKRVNLNEALIND